MLFSNLPENALYCWKLGTEYISKNHYQVFQDDTIFQFPTGLKVISEKDGREWLLAVTSRYQNVVTRKVKPGEVNYRILKAPVEDLIAGTPCAN
ncbi:hypothetical protein C0J52_02778 [Blattella germanica]|nr:hypothetical protein C0J52_02778 [Blattella germanica]